MIEFDEDLLGDVENIIEELDDMFKWTAAVADVQELRRDRRTFKAVVKSYDVLAQVMIDWRNGRRELYEHLMEKYAHIEWKQNADMRIWTVHKYFRLDDDILWSTIRNDLPPLRKVMEEIRADCRAEIESRNAAGSD